MDAEQRQQRGREGERQAEQPHQSDGGERAGVDEVDRVERHEHDPEQAPAQRLADEGSQGTRVEEIDRRKAFRQAGEVARVLGLLGQEAAQLPGHEEAEGERPELGRSPVGPLEVERRLAIDQQGHHGNEGHAHPASDAAAPTTLRHAQRVGRLR